MKKTYHLRVSETYFYTMVVEAENAEEARKRWEEGFSSTLKCHEDEITDEVLAVEVMLPPCPEKDRDVHTEHCCLTCGCKYSDENCTVTTEQKKQSSPHNDEWCH